MPPPPVQPKTLPSDRLDLALPMGILVAVASPAWRTASAPAARAEEEQSDYLAVALQAADAVAPVNAGPDILLSQEPRQGRLSSIYPVPRPQRGAVP